MIKELRKYKIGEIAKLAGVSRSQLMLFLSLTADFENQDLIQIKELVNGVLSESLSLVKELIVFLNQVTNI